MSQPHGSTPLEAWSKRRGLPPWTAALSAAVLLPLAALFILARIKGSSLGGRPPLSLLLLPSLLASYLAGFWPGILATALSAAFSAFFLFSPQGSFRLDRPEDALAWAAAVLTGTLTCVLLDAARCRSGAAVSGPLDPGRRPGAAREWLLGVGYPGRLALALLIPLAAAGLQFLLWSQLKPYMFLLFYPAVFLSAWLGGLATAVPAALLSSVLMTFLFVPPVNSFHKGNLDYLGVMLVFAAVGILFGRFHDRLGEAEHQRLEGMKAQSETQQATIRSQTNLLQRMSRLCQAGGWSFDVATGKGEWTEEVARIHDLDPAAATSLEVGLSVYRGKHRAAMETALQEAVASGKPYDLELELVTVKGTRKWVRTQGHPVLENGKVARLEGAFQDITSWKELQAGLRESEARLQLFIEHGPAAQAMFDKGLRYLAASRRWREDHGLGDSPFLGRRHPEVAPAFPPAWEAAHRRALAGEVVSRDEDALPGPGGSVRWLRWEARPWRDPDGEVQGIVVFSEDFTQRKQAEERVHQLNASLEKRVEERTSELQAANQELEAFSYAVSHDLRSPMRAMSGFSQALQEDFAAQLPPDARSYLDQIALGARRMGDLIDGLLALSRVTRGDLERDPVDLGALAREVRDELERSDPARRVDWRIQEGLWVQGDARMLQVVVRNLLENAWKYTSKVPQAAIAVERVEEEGEPAVQVTDNGAGFDMAYASKLFAPFQRLHRQDEFPGLGIGLATVQRILHRHGGRIQARSQPGRGAAFTLFLPLLEVQP